MKKQISTLLIGLFSIWGYSQNSEFEYPNFIGQNLYLVENNPNWLILQKSSGDLNKDGMEDYALILESKDSVFEKRCSSCYVLKNKPRIILVFFNQNGNQEVIIQNNRFIARGDEGGMEAYIEPELSVTDG